MRTSFVCLRSFFREAVSVISHSCLCCQVFGQVRVRCQYHSGLVFGSVRRKSAASHLRLYLVRLRFHRILRESSSSWVCVQLRLEVSRLQILARRQWVEVFRKCRGSRTSGEVIGNCESLEMFEKYSCLNVLLENGQKCPMSQCELIVKVQGGFYILRRSVGTNRKTRVRWKMVRSR